MKRKVNIHNHFSPPWGGKNSFAMITAGLAQTLSTDSNYSLLLPCVNLSNNHWLPWTFLLLWDPRPTVAWNMKQCGHLQQYILLSPHGLRPTLTTTTHYWILTLQHCHDNINSLTIPTIIDPYFAAVQNCCENFISVFRKLFLQLSVKVYWEQLRLAKSSRYSEHYFLHWMIVVECWEHRTLKETGMLQRSKHSSRSQTEKNWI